MNIHQTLIFMGFLLATSINDAFCSLPHPQPLATYEKNKDIKYSSSDDAPVLKDLLIFHAYHKKKTWEPAKRNLGAYGFLPNVWVQGNSLLMEGNVSIENLSYQVLDSQEIPILTGVITIDKDETQTINLNNIPQGSYLFLLTLGDEAFAAEFHI